MRPRSGLRGYRISMPAADCTRTQSTSKKGGLQAVLLITSAPKNCNPSLRSGQMGRELTTGPSGHVRLREGKADALTQKGRRLVRIRLDWTDCWLHVQLGRNRFVSTTSKKFQ